MNRYANPLGFPSGFVIERVKGAKKIPVTQVTKGHLLAEGEEPATRTPVIDKPVEVQAALAAAATEIRHAAVAVDPSHRPKFDDWKLTLEFGVLRSESQKFLDRRRPKTLTVQISQHRLGTHALPVVDELTLERDRAKRNLGLNIITFINLTPMRTPSSREVLELTKKNSFFV